MKGFFQHMKNWFHNGIKFSHDFSYVHVSDVGVKVPNYRKTIQCTGEKKIQTQYMKYLEGYIHFFPPFII